MESSIVLNLRSNDHIKFQLNQTFSYVADKNFKMATMAASHHLGYQDKTILAFLNLHVAPIPSMMFRLNPTFCLERDVNFEEFQDDHHGGHLGDQDRMILAILTLHAAPISPMKFQLNPWWPSLISGQNDFSNSESPCHTNASHQVSAKSDFWFGRKCHLMNFKMATMMAILDVRT